MKIECLRDLLQTNNRKVTIEEIQKVAEYFNIRLDMSSPRRARAVARPDK